jgi:hypothetical protein
MLNLQPNLYLRMIEQDRERAMAQRALERAARGDGKASPGLARGGINLFADAIRRAGAALAHLPLGSSGSSSSAQPAAGA